VATLISNAAAGAVSLHKVSACNRILFQVLGRATWPSFGTVAVLPEYAREEMTARQFTLHSIRTSKHRGNRFNVGKDHEEYQAIVNTLTMHPEDMKALSIPPGARVRLRTVDGEAVFLSRPVMVPLEILSRTAHRPAGSWAAKPTAPGCDSKGWEVEVELIRGGACVLSYGSRGR